MSNFVSLREYVESLMQQRFTALDNAIAAANTAAERALTSASHVNDTRLDALKTRLEALEARLRAAEEIASNSAGRFWMLGASLSFALIVISIIINVVLHFVK